MDVGVSSVNGKSLSCKLWMKTSSSALGNHGNPRGSHRKAIGKPLMEKEKCALETCN